MNTHLTQGSEEQLRQLTWEAERMAVPIQNLLFLLKRVHYKKKGERFSRPQPGCHIPNSLAGQEKFNYSPPGNVWFVTFRLGTGKSLTFFYSVDLGCTEGFQQYVGLDRATKYVRGGGELRNTLYFTFPGQHNQVVKMLQPSV
jgi:hypothetical protein